MYAWGKRMKRSRSLINLRLFVFLVAGLSGFCSWSERSEVPPSVEFTWMSNTNWLIETPEVRILLDGWITRIPRPPRPDINDVRTLSVPPVLPDTEGITRVFDSLGDKRIDYILSGHSHFDHSFDTAVWARLTGAHVIGPKSTCLQAFAQGIPEAQCSIINGRETFDLGGGLKVRVVRWHHSGDISTPIGLLLQTPMELKEMPSPDSETGGLRPGILEDFPIGGGCWAYLFTLDHPEHPLSWFYSNSGNPNTFYESKIVDQAFIDKYGIDMTNLEIIPQEKSIEEYLIEAVEAQGLESVDLWLGYNNSLHVKQVISVMRPDAFIPQHWGGLWSDFFKGLQSPYSNERLISVLREEGIDFFPQTQFMDKYRLDKAGVIPVTNDEVKKRLGFVQ